MSGMNRLTDTEVNAWANHGDAHAQSMARELLAHRRASQAAPAPSDGLREAAQALVDRWDSPVWGGSAVNLRHTGEYIAARRAEAEDLVALMTPIIKAFLTDVGFEVTNLALGQPIAASSVTQTYTAANANDGSTSSYWEGGGGQYPAHLTVDLGAAADVPLLVRALTSCLS